MNGVISDLSAIVFIMALMAIGVFVCWSMKNRQRVKLIHKLYLLIAVLYGIWVIALLGIRLTHPENMTLLFIWDAITNSVGSFIPVLCLCIAIVFIKGYEQMPRWGRFLFIVPVISNVVIWTNPIFHMQYKVFSIVKSEIVFGPYMVVSGGYNYLCLIVSIVLMVNFALRNRSRLYLMQCALFAVGGICPLIVSILATFSDNMPITATPLSFIPTIICNGIAIYQLHILDIKPLATQHVLDWVSDCYLVLSEEGLVISYNKPFDEIFAQDTGISENRYLKDCVKQNVSNKSVVYNLLTAMESSRESQTVISYEQAITIYKKNIAQKNYYVADVSPLIFHEKLSGFVVTFKDITQLKKSMRQLQESQARMMEQERLASLGQMIGGLAHNLKTPIMSICGCISASEALLEECKESLDDPQVLPDDYREIYGELEGWFEKVKESAAYMSDIITAIKGQAASASDSQTETFTIDELVKRCALLMRHELFSSGCSLTLEVEKQKDIRLHGDINNLIQVLNNLISNAIDAQKEKGGAIVVGAKQDKKALHLYVKDRGTGIKPEIRKRLFREMVTSKGMQGTGLGLYISNAVVRGKFGGKMWVRENEEGGSIVGLSVPLHSIVMSNHLFEKKGAGIDEKK